MEGSSRSGEAFRILNDVYQAYFKEKGATPSLSLVLDYGNTLARIVKSSKYSVGALQLLQGIIKSEIELSGKHYPLERLESFAEISKASESGVQGTFLAVRAFTDIYSELTGQALDEDRFNLLVEIAKSSEYWTFGSSSALREVVKISALDSDLTKQPISIDRLNTLAEISKKAGKENFVVFKSIHNLSSLYAKLHNRPIPNDLVMEYGVALSEAYSFRSTERIVNVDELVNLYVEVKQGLPPVDFISKYFPVLDKIAKSIRHTVCSLDGIFSNNIFSTLVGIAESYAEHTKEFIPSELLEEYGRILSRVPRHWEDSCGLNDSQAIQKFFKGVSDLERLHSKQALECIPTEVLDAYVDIITRTPGDKQEQLNILKILEQTLNAYYKKEKEVVPLKFLKVLSQICQKTEFTYAVFSMVENLLFKPRESLSSLDELFENLHKFLSKDALGRIRYYNNNIRGNSEIATIEDVNQALKLLIEKLENIPLNKLTPLVVA
ncbi:MAG: hypothetical protein R3A13_07115 [Bdellovibrionota bacterium]